MKLVRVFAMGTAVVFLGICAVYAACGRSGQDRVPSSICSSEKVMERPLPVDRNSGRRDGSPDEVMALRQELRQLRAEIAALRQQSAAKDSAPAEVRPAAPGKDVRRDPAARAEAEAARQAQIEEIESNFRSEPSDPRWASDTTSAIREALGSAQLAQSSLRNVECRSHMCRVELINDGSRAFQKSLPIFALQLGQVLPSAIVNQIEEGNGVATTVLYMSGNP